MPPTCPPFAAPLFAKSCTLFQICLPVYPGLEIDSLKVETNRYSIKEKLENNAIDYRLQSIVPALGLETDS